LNTEEIMEVALKLAGLTEVPEDSAIYVKGENIQRVPFCIDAGPPELMLAKQLGCDAVIAHHPAGGSAVLGFPKVFRRHVQLMVEAGIPREKAELAVSRKFEQLSVEAHARNYAHAVDFARLLKMPFMNVHMPLDEIGRKRMVEQIDNRVGEESTVSDVISP